MTTKRKAQGDAKDKGKPGRPLELYGERGVRRNPFAAQEEAEAAVRTVCEYLFSQSEPASMFLLVLYALANEHDEAARSCMYYDACRYLTGEIDGIEEAFEADHVRTLAELRTNSRDADAG